MRTTKYRTKRMRLWEKNPVEEGRGQLLSLIGLSRPIPVLPPEIKYSILSHVTDPATLKTCCAASPQLSSLLHHRKLIFLFPDILPFIYGPGKSRVHHQALLTLRGVCKSWKNSIDSFIQNHPAKNAYSSDFHIAQVNQSPEISRRWNYYLDPYSVSRYAFQVNLSPDDRSLSKFIQEFSSVAVNPQYNPFVGRSLILTMNMQIDIFDFDEIIRYVGRLALFLKKFGHHIYHLTLKMPQNPVVAYAIFRDFDVAFLQFLPNLRSLTIYSLEMFPVLRRDLQRRINNGFRIIPELYPMINLESISIYYSGPKLEEVSVLLVQPYAWKLTRLSLPSWEHGPEKNLPNLKELTMTWLSCNSDLEGLMEVEAKNLEKLRLQFRWKRVSVKVLHKCLLKFRGSLKNLELDWCGNEVEAEGKALLLRGGAPKGDEQKLCKVHTLKVSNALGVDYGFLRWLPGLKSLYLGEKVMLEEGVGIMDEPTGRMKKILDKVVKKEGKAGGVEIHKYLWDQKNMHKSNVWTICDMLRLIKFNKFRMRIIEGEDGHSHSIQEGLEVIWRKSCLRGKRDE